MVAASRRPTTEEAEPEDTYVLSRGATARLSWLACLGEHILVLTRGVNIEVDGLYEERVEICLQDRYDADLSSLLWYGL